ncbi:hypothetical protein GCM10023219_20440 [Stakelama sediminis]|uniref:Uncharacterized protein n=1 Tax=Stakelama sediminis TaxID=463200 RepID=A0A840Z3R3_9SPHN|nr:hypothetical protein [Stakelama sediminis]MBB5720350.1 hypothetical protein [Stakelama sediminis]
MFCSRLAMALSCMMLSLPGQVTVARAAQDSAESRPALNIRGVSTGIGADAARQILESHGFERISATPSGNAPDRIIETYILRRNGRKIDHVDVVSLKHGTTQKVAVVRRVKLYGTTEKPAIQQATLPFLQAFGRPASAFYYKQANADVLAFRGANAAAGCMAFPAESIPVQKVPLLPATFTKGAPCRSGMIVQFKFKSGSERKRADATVEYLYALDVPQTAGKAEPLTAAKARHLVQGDWRVSGPVTSTGIITKDADDRAHAMVGKQLRMAGTALLYKNRRCRIGSFQYAANTDSDFGSFGGSWKDVGLTTGQGTPYTYPSYDADIDCGSGLEADSLPDGIKIANGGALILVRFEAVYARLKPLVPANSAEAPQLVLDPKCMAQGNWFASHGGEYNRPVVIASKDLMLNGCRPTAQVMQGKDGWSDFSEKDPETGFLMYDFRAKMLTSPVAPRHIATVEFVINGGGSMTSVYRIIGEVRRDAKGAAYLRAGSYRVESLEGDRKPASPAFGDLEQFLQRTGSSDPHPLRFEADSRTARGITGNLTMTGKLLHFEKGQALKLGTSRPVTIRGKFLASMLGVNTGTTVKAWKVVDQYQPERAQGICDGGVGYVILQVEKGARPQDTLLTLAAYPKGINPGGGNNEICGTFGYAK